MDKPPNRIAERAERKPRARLNEKTPNPLSFSCKIGLLFWSGHSNRVSGIFFVIMRGIHSWKLPNVAPASLLTAASEGLSQTAGTRLSHACLVSAFFTPRPMTPSPGTHGRFAHISTGFCDGMRSMPLGVVGFPCYLRTAKAQRDKRETATRAAGEIFRLGAQMNHSVPYSPFSVSRCAPAVVNLTSSMLAR